MKSRLTLALVTLSLAACGGSTAADDAGRPADDAAGGAATDAARSDAAGDPGGDTGASGSSLHGCAEADFLDLTAGPPDSRMIMVPRGTNTFDFPCITIRAGQAVMFMWDFAAHPLAAGVAPSETGTGTEPSPIEPQSTGVLYEPVFPTAGDYPFYCTPHHASGMFGVVRVIP